jgi:rhodanese-related sulfurtransferase
VIVDVRESPRYNGITEPIDLVAGHIPNAQNFPFIDNLDEKGLFKSPEELRNLYSELFENYDKSKITFHCGSGVTACHSLLALDYAGFDIPICMLEAGASGAEMKFNFVKLLIESSIIIIQSNLFKNWLDLHTSDMDSSVTGVSTFVVDIQLNEGINGLLDI